MTAAGEIGKKLSKLCIRHARNKRQHLQETVYSPKPRTYTEQQGDQGHQADQTGQVAAVHDQLFVVSLPLSFDTAHVVYSVETSTHSGEAAVCFEGCQSCIRTYRSQSEAGSKQAGENRHEYKSTFVTLVAHPRQTYVDYMRQISTSSLLGPITL